MIKNWYRFFESDSYTIEKFIDDFSNVRDIFGEFEDLSLVSYNVSTSDDTYHKSPVPHSSRSIGYTFEPGDNRPFDNPIDKLNHFKDMIRYRVEKAKHIIIEVNIKFPSIPNHSGSLIDMEGIKLFEEILTASYRLKDIGYSVILDMNAVHHQYKPIKFIIKVK
jgi:hypothetical protein